VYQGEEKERMALQVFNAPWSATHLPAFVVSSQQDKCVQLQGPAQRLGQRKGKPLKADERHAAFEELNGAAAAA